MDTLTDQPALFDEPASPADSVAIVQMCHLCDQPLSKVDVAHGDRWHEAVLWGYVSLQAHLKTDHPDEYRGPLP